MKPLNRLALRNEPEAAHHEGLWWQDVSEWTEKKYGGVGDSEKKGRGQKNREEWTVTPNTLGFAQWVKVEPSSSELPCTWHESCFQDAPEPPLQAITFRVCSVFPGASPTNSVFLAPSYRHEWPYSTVTVTPMRGVFSFSLLKWWSKWHSENSDKHEDF